MTKRTKPDPFALQKAQRAVEQLLAAYAHGALADGVKWEHLDEAFGLAKQALPGRYEQLVDELERRMNATEQFNGPVAASSSPIFEQLRERMAEDPNPPAPKTQGGGLNSRIRRNRTRIGLPEVPTS